MPNTLMTSDFVNVGLDGTFSTDGQIASSPQTVDALVQRLATEKPKRLLFVFHGGLVDEARAVGGIEKVHEQLARDGVRPIYFVWETGLGDIVKDILDEMSAGWFSRIVAQVSALVVPRVGGDANRGDVREEVRRQLERARPFDEFDTDRARAAATYEMEEGLEENLNTEAEEFVLDDLQQFREVLSDIPPEVRDRLRDRGIEASDARGGGWWWLVKALARIGWRTLERFRDRRDHGVYPTILEETLREIGLDAIGRRIWSEMKERAFEMWLPNDGLSGNQQHAGRYFIERLASARSADPAWEFTIDVAGHSAGAVVVCELLKMLAARAQGSIVRRVVLHAPACTTSLFVREVVAQPTRWTSVRIFTMDDATECRDSFGGFLYPRSLLYFISGVLEARSDCPILGLERHVLGAGPTVDPDLAAFFTDANLSERLVFSPTKDDAIAGFRSGATTHAGFADDRTTLESLVLLAAGT